MAAIDHIFAITIMAFILVFSGIHLGVGIGIILPFRKYGDLFRAQIGLASYNIAVSFFGFVAGSIGLLAIWKKSKLINRIMCVLSILVGVMALASLVTAIILNSMSLNNVSNKLTKKIQQYSIDSNANDDIDLFQTNYQCCGVEIWLDWKVANLIATNITTTTTTTKPTTTITTTVTTTTITTTVTTTTSTTTMEITTVTTTTVESTNITTSSQARKDSIVSINHPEKLNRVEQSRAKRQSAAMYGGIPDLPLTFSVTLPRSCCQKEATIPEGISDLYCISNANNAVNHFNIDGCLKPMAKVASNQFTGFCIINSFLIVLAFIAVPVLLESRSMFI